MCCSMLMMGCINVLSSALCRVHSARLPRLQELASLQCLVERTSSVQSGPFWESLLQSKSFVILQLHPCDTKVPYTLGTRPKHAGDSCECLRPKAQIPYLSRLGPIGRT